MSLPTKKVKTQKLFDETKIQQEKEDENSIINTDITDKPLNHKNIRNNYNNPEIIKQTDIVHEYLDIKLLYFPDPIDSLQILMDNNESLVIIEELDRERFKGIENRYINYTEMIDDLSYRAIQNLSRIKNNIVILDNFDNIDNLLVTIENLNLYFKQKTKKIKLIITTNSPFLLLDLYNHQKYSKIPIIKEEPFFRDFFTQIELIYHNHNKEESETRKNKMIILKELIKHLKEEIILLIGDNKEKKYLKNNFNIEILTYYEYHDIYRKTKNDKVIVLYDYMPIKSKNKKYLISHEEEEDFYRALVETEDMIYSLTNKNAQEDNKIICIKDKDNIETQNINISNKNDILNNKKTENNRKNKDFSYFVIDREYQYKIINYRSNNTKEIEISKNNICRIKDEEIRNNSIFNKLYEGEYISKKLDVPLRLKTNREINSNKFKVGITNVKLGHMDQKDSFSNNIDIIGNGILIVGNKSINIIGTVKNNNITIKDINNKQSKDITKYIKIVIENITEDKLFYFNKKIFILLKHYPKFFYSTDRVCDKNINTYNNIGWRRGDRYNFPMVEGRYDICVEIKHGDILMLLLNLEKYSKIYFYNIFIYGINKQNIDNKIIGKMNVQDQLDVERGLTPQEILKFCKDLSFDDRYFILCFLSR
ncbi:hypothetical protein SLOPH_2569, partial [Spraguea lophii 42_110]